MSVVEQLVTFENKFSIFFSTVLYRVIVKIIYYKENDIIHDIATSSYIDTL